MTKWLNELAAKLGKWMLGPTLELVYRATVQFLKWWRDAPWSLKLASFPVLLVALAFYGAWRFLKGGCE